MKTWQIGDVRITQVVESGGIPTSGLFFFPAANPEFVKRYQWLKPHFANDEGKLFASIHAFIIETKGRRIIVDTCVGNDKSRRVKAWNRLQTPFLDNLAKAGHPADSIDQVICTHLHIDHVGWNTRLVDGRWVPTFPNARYLFGRVEWEHWSNEPVGPDDDDIVGDSVRPIVDAGLADLVEMDHRLSDEVWLEPTPGHTPGHVSIRIASGGQQAVITGDLMHHPIQCSEPDLPNNFDSDPEAARQTRRAFLSRYEGQPVLVLGTHFAPPTGGWIVRAGETWQFAANPPAAHPVTTAGAPLIIEAALNGATPKRMNPRVPLTPAEVAADAIACLDAGASIIHSHTADPVIGGSGIHDPQPYLDAWRVIVAARPHALLYPTMAGGGPHVSIEQRYSHIVTLARSGLLAQGLVDPGTTNFGRLDENGLPRPDEIIYQNTYRDSVTMIETCRELGIGLSISIFEPGFLRVILAYHAAGRLPPGSLVKLYFGAGKTLFGLPPSRAALEAYLDMLAGTGLPWLVSAQGGDVIACGLAELALARGGHLQVGLEPSADRTRSNVELVREAVNLAERLGRPVADSRQAARLLELPPRPQPN